MNLEDLHSNDLELLVESLHRLREVKSEAYQTVIKAPGHERFTLADFGVPTIDALLAKIDVALERADSERSV